MNFEPYDKDVIILEKRDQENTTSSGLIVGDTITQYVVVKGDKGLLNKEVFFDEKPTPLRDNFYAINTYNIMAYKDVENK